MSLRPDWLTFRRYAGLTTGMTLALFAIGVYTAATGSGLACQAQWPLCSDQLVPALTFNPDFVEWFHRVWAMVTGFFIIGMAGWAWRLDDRRIRLAATLAVVVLPLQIAVGAVTVTVGGLVPGGYTMSTHALHLVVALLIFTFLGLATFWAGSDGRGPSVRRVRLTLFAALGLLLAGAVFSRAIPLLTYSPGAQAWFYGLSLSGYLALLSVVVDTYERGGFPGSDRVRALTIAAIALLVGTLLLGRDLVLYDATWQLVNLLVLAGALVGVAAAAWLLGRESPTSASRSGVTDAD
ncbi:cytochrome c oxidase assembly protein [Halalkaliarchaeum desulfuricum]|uniref:Cytochrome c oxidase assembly protein n=2 Tax=Halalkaliarchaeum desulfuricum TaxID=2055893 RepID=A0A343TG29_9EURY|nr:COX15/CtaA family protein [Halalkaliarchaeum desulfuricum]AUX08051.1 cytochrome c oxidase assembly protein [Halalkaliarchaeum desulfuricum]